MASFHLRRPPVEAVERRRRALQGAPFSYAEIGATQNGGFARGFNVDGRRVRLGAGAACFRAAVQALRRWTMFQTGFTFVHPEVPPVAAGEIVGVVVRAFGLWWPCFSRIVYVIDEPRRFGFAYGTLTAHAERGEERFLVDWSEADDGVWYDLHAFSLPRHPLARLGYPVTRALQRRFGEASAAAMVAAVKTASREGD